MTEPQTPTTGLFDRLPVLADGDVSGWLRSQLPQRKGPVAGLNLQAPQKVAAAHQAFLQAGARLIRTNTSHAHWPALDVWEMADRTEAINGSAYGCALEATQPYGEVNTAIMGVVSPVHDLRPDQAVVAYGEQMVFLADAGVDFVMLEHFESLEAAHMALLEGLKVTDAPVLALLRLNAKGQTKEGIAWANACAQLVEAGAEALGVSCWEAGEIEALIPLVQEVLSLGKPLAVFLASTQGGVAESDALAFGEATQKLGELGVQIVGGCCGVTPQHVAAAAKALGR